MTVEQRANKAKYQRRWYLANQGAVREAARVRRLADPEKVRVSRRRYYLTNTTKVRAAGAAWRLANPESALAIGRAARARHGAWNAAQKDKACADCGVQYPSYVMQFDHRNPTEKCFTIGAKRGHSRPVLEAEIAKCDVVCANCHMERTHQRRIGAAA